MSEFTPVMLSPTPEPPVTIEWRCFHCDEVFTDKAEAREHFGSDEWKTPACRLAGVDVKLLRELEADNAELRRENDRLDNDARLWHEAEAERKRLQGRYRHGRDTSWFMFLDSLEGERLVLTERAADLLAALHLAAEALDAYSDVNDGPDGPTPNRALSALQEIGEVILKAEGKPR